MNKLEKNMKMYDVKNKQPDRSLLKKFGITLEDASEYLEMSMDDEFLDMLPKYQYYDSIDIISFTQKHAVQCLGTYRAMKIYDQSLDRYKKIAQRQKKKNDERRDFKLKDKTLTLERQKGYMKDDLSFEHMEMRSKNQSKKTRALHPNKVKKMMKREEAEKHSALIESNKESKDLTKKGRKDRRMKKLNIIAESKYFGDEYDVYIQAEADHGMLHMEAVLEDHRHVDVIIESSMDEFMAGDFKDVETEPKPLTGDVENIVTPPYYRISDGAIEDILADTVETEDSLVTKIVNKIKSTVGSLYQDAIDHLYSLDLDKSLSIMDIVTEVCILLWRMYRDKRTDMRSLAIYTFLRRLGVGDGMFKKLIETLMSTPKRVIEAQSSFTVIDEVTLFMEKLIDSPVLNAIRNMVMSVVSLKIFDADISGNIASVFGKMGKLSILAMVALLIKGILALAKFGSNLIGGTSFSEALLGDDPVRSVIKEANDLMINKDHTYECLPIKHYVYIGDYIKRVQNTIGTIDLIYPKIRKSSDLKADLNHWRRVLVTILKEKELRFFKDTRVQPIGIFVYGQSRVGKGPLEALMMKLSAHVLGFEYAPGMTFWRNPASSYHEGWDPLTTKFWGIKELGNENISIRQRQLNPLLVEMTPLMDSNAFPCNTAFGDKGTKFANPFAVFVDSNNAYMGAKEGCDNPEAILARFTRFRVEIKPEFRVQGSHRLDVQKSLDVHDNDPDDEIMDRVIIYPETFEISGQEIVVTPVAGAEDGIRDIREFARWYADWFYKKVATAVRIRNEVTLDINKYVPKYEAPIPAEVIWDRIDFEEAPNGMFLAKYVEYEAPWYHWLYDNYQFTRVISKIMGTIGLCAFLATFGVMQRILRKVPWYLRWLLYVFIVLTYVFVPQVGGVMSFMIGAYRLTTELSGDIFTTMLDKIKECISELAHQGARVMADKAKAHVEDLVSTWWIRHKRKALGATVFLGGVFAGKMLYDYTRKIQTESHLEELQDSADCKPVGSKRIPINGTQLWNVQQPVSRAAHSGSVSSLYDTIRSNIRGVFIVDTGADINTSAGYSQYCLGVSKQYALVNKHAFLKYKDTGEAFDVYVAISGKVTLSKKGIPVTLYYEDLIPISDDIVMIVTKVSFRDITKHISEIAAVRGSNAYIDGQGTSIKATFDGEIVEQRYNVTLPVAGLMAYTYSEHALGKCGLPLVVYNGGSSVCGLHAGGAHSDGFAAPFIRKQVLEAIADYEQTHMMFVVDENYDNILTKGKITAQSEFIYLEEPIRKSSVRYIDVGGIKYFGKMPGKVIMNRKSKVKRTPWSGEVQQLLKDLGLKQKKDFGPPPLYGFWSDEDEYISPENILLTTLSRQKKSLDPKILDKVREAIFSRVDEMVISDIHPYDVHTAVNGDPNDPFIRRMNLSTASGFGYTGQKREQFEENKDGDYEPLNHVVKKLVDMYKCYMDSKRYNPITIIDRKDEPRDEKKNKLGKTRMFGISPLEYVIACRQFLGPFYTRMVEHNKHFFTAVGIDMLRNGYTIKEFLDAYNTLWGEIDYESYDITLPLEISELADEVMLYCLEKWGYNWNALKIVAGILTDALYPLILVNMDLFEAAGYQVSGFYDTTCSNSLKNLLLLMYIWYAQTSDSFFDNCRAATNGDDLLYATKKSYEGILHPENFQKLAAQFFGMVATSAAKDGGVCTWVTSENATFLKRTFEWSETLGRTVTPLSADSIFRMLMWYIPSTVSMHVQFEGTFNSALMELFLHLDESQFNTMRNFFMVCLEVDCDAKGEIDRRLKTWSEVKEMLSI